MRVSSIQHIDITMTGTTQTAAIPTPVGDLTKSIVVGTWELSDITEGMGADVVQCVLAIDDINTVSITRNTALGTVYATVSVIQFSDEVIVQKGTFAMTSSELVADVTVSATVLANSWIMHYDRMDELSWSNDSDPNTRLIAHELTTTTNLRLERLAADGAVNGNWFIVESIDNSVTHQDTHFTTNSLVVELGTTVVQANTMLCTSVNTTEAIYNGEAQYYARLTSTTQFSLGNFRTEQLYVNSQTIESTNLTVQEGAILDSSLLTDTYAITTVDLTRSIILPTAQPGMMSANPYANATLDSRFVRFQFADASNITWSRGDAETNTSLGFQIIQFALGGILITNIETTNSVYEGQTGTTITGVGFEAVQGTGSVIICPTDDINDVNAVTQTVTSWSDTVIDVTADFPASIAIGSIAYVFVTNDTGESPANGFALLRAPEFCTLSTTLVGGTSLTGINYYVMTTDDPNTAALLFNGSGETSDVSGVFSLDAISYWQQLTDGSYVIGVAANSVDLTEGVGLRLLTSIS